VLDGEQEKRFFFFAIAVVRERRRVDGVFGEVRFRAAGRPVLLSHTAAPRQKRAHIDAIGR
jgi:hypothetical protein